MAHLFGTSAHPYYPQDADISGYAANISSAGELIYRFAAILGLTVLTAVLAATSFNPKLTRSEKSVLAWFVVSGSLHCFFEGYFILNHATLASSQDLFAQLWKEYALSDSRYLTSDPFMLSIEAISVLALGPLCLATALSVARRGTLRHPLQIIASVGHLYSVALYYATCYAAERYQGVVFSRPEFRYFWVYYVGFNSPWVFVPAGIILHSIKNINRSTEAFDKVAASLDKKKDRLKAAFA